MDKGHVLPIGKIAKCTGIPEKRLRYYDECGMCSPEYRDPVTGYRYYSEKQVQTLHWISYLRSLDIPTAQIAEFVNAEDPSGLKSALDEQVLKNRERLMQVQYRCEQVAEMRQRLYIALGHLRSGGSAGMVSLVNVEPVYILNFDTELDSRSITDADRGKMFDHLAREAQRLSQVTVGGAVLLYRNHPLLAEERATPGQTSYLLQVKNPPLTPMEHIRFMKNYRAATVVHVGPHDTLPEAYRTICRWAAENKVALGTDVIEDYQITGAMSRDPQYYVTQLYVPLRGQAL